MNTPSERRLALDITSLVRNGGRASGALCRASCRRLWADDGLRPWLDAIDPTDEEAWDSLRRHIRGESHRLRLPEIDAVRQLLPTWRAQGVLLGAVHRAVRQAEGGDGVPPDDSGAVASGCDTAEGFGGGGFGFGA